MTHRLLVVLPILLGLTATSFADPCRPGRGPSCQQIIVAYPAPITQYVVPAWPSRPPCRPAHPGCGWQHVGTPSYPPVIVVWGPSIAISRPPAPLPMFQCPPPYPGAQMLFAP